MMVPRALGGWMPTGSSPIPGSASYNVARGNVHISMSAKANELFTTYTAKAPPESGRLFGRCWDIVEQARRATVPNAEEDASAFDGALDAFVTSGPDDVNLVPEVERELLAALADTAASYHVLSDDKRLSWGTCYRTLNAPLGAFYCGLSLWPRTSVDVPNFTLYFGSGSAVDPSRVFMRLECTPRVDTDTDASYAEKYYAPFNERFFTFLERGDVFEPYVSDSAYERGALSPSGVRVFFENNEDNWRLVADAVLEQAAQWASFVDTAPELQPYDTANMARRDALVRRVAAENSPDNSNRQRVFGAQAFTRTQALLMGNLDM